MNRSKDLDAFVVSPTRMSSEQVEDSSNAASGSDVSSLLNIAPNVAVAFCDADLFSSFLSART